MKWWGRRYMEHVMKTLGHNQEEMRKHLQEALGGLFPFGPLEEMGKQNLELFEKTMKMFAPFPAMSPTDKLRGDKPPEERPGDASLKELTDRLHLLQQVEPVGEFLEAGVAGTLLPRLEIGRAHV